VKFHHTLIHLAFFLLLVAGLTSSCDLISQRPAEIEAGFSRDEVLDALGEPDMVQDFILPDQPFFGPQEGLADIVPPGRVVEEWRYESEETIRLVWFTGEPEADREDWTVIATVSYPAGAVY